MCFNRYQKYMENPYPVIKRKPAEEKKDNFKYLII
jgi:hypothetical protein